MKKLMLISALFCALISPIYADFVKGKGKVCAETLNVYYQVSEVAPPTQGESWSVLKNVPITNCGDGQITNLSYTSQQSWLVVLSTNDLDTIGPGQTRFLDVAIVVPLLEVGEYLGEIDLTYNTNGRTVETKTIHLNIKVGDAFTEPGDYCLEASPIDLDFSFEQNTSSGTKNITVSSCDPTTTEEEPNT